MAWGLQNHMYSHVTPSIHFHLEQMENEKERFEWLAETLATQLYERENKRIEQEEEIVQGETIDLDLYYETKKLEIKKDLEKFKLNDSIVEQISELAIENGTTTNGGHEIYLDKWTTVEWCSEDYLLEFYS